jgi:hypothetical protein
MTGGFEVILKNSIGSSVRLATAVAADCWLVKVDPGELELALANVARHEADTGPRQELTGARCGLRLLSR